MQRNIRPTSHQTQSLRHLTSPLWPKTPLHQSRLAPGLPTPVPANTSSCQKNISRHTNRPKITQYQVSVVSNVTEPATLPSLPTSKLRHTILRLQMPYTFPTPHITFFRSGAWPTLACPSSLRRI